MHNENEKVKSFKAYKRKKKNKNKRGIFKRKTGVLVIILIAAIGVGNLCIYQVSSKLKYQIYYLNMIYPTDSQKIYISVDD